jgi:hypothetical protein
MMSSESIRVKNTTKQKMEIPYRRKIGGFLE